MKVFKKVWKKPKSRIVLGTLCSLVLSMGFVELTSHIELLRHFKSSWSMLLVILLFLVIWLASYLIPALLIVYSLVHSLKGRVEKRERLFIILISYLSIAFSFGGMYYSMCTVADWNDATARDIHYYWEGVSLRVNKDYRIRLKGDERAFHGIEQRLWSGVDWPINKKGEATVRSDELVNISPEEMVQRADEDPRKVVRFIPSARLPVILDCIHFSVDTITTVGYGDITPKTWYAKLAADVEVLSGLVLFVVALGMLFGNWSAG